MKTNATPYGYLVNHRDDINDASDIALTILAMKTVGQDPRDFKGRNLIKALRARRGNGSFGNDVNVTAFAVLAFARSPPPRRAVFHSTGFTGRKTTTEAGAFRKARTAIPIQPVPPLMAVTGDKGGKPGDQIPRRDPEEVRRFRQQRQRQRTVDRPHGVWSPRTAASTT